MGAGLVQTYRAFAYNNAWSNHRLLAACSKLQPGEFEAERIGFFPSLQATPNHIYIIDLFYIDALEGGWLTPDVLVLVEEAADAGFDFPAGFAEIERRDYGDTRLFIGRAESAR